MLKLIKDCIRPLFIFFSDVYSREYYTIFSKYAKAPRYQQRTIKFLDYTVIVSDAPSFAYQYKEIFCERTYEFRSAKSNPVIYDCGANIGISCIYFNRLYPNAVIKAFEADPAIFKLLEHNVKKNVRSNTIELFNQAVWVNNDGVDFSNDGADGGSVIDQTDKPKIKVTSTWLRELISHETIDLLKLDIEGAETAVLLDCDGYLENVQRIFFEYHSFANEPQQLNELLHIISKNGFRYFIQSPSVQQAPFLKKHQNQKMDLQLNVYCYR